MGWKTLYIENGDKLSLYLDNLKVLSGDIEHLYLINDLTMVIIDNPVTIITTKALNALSTQNVGLILCDEKHLPQTQCIPFSGYYNNSESLQNQIKWSAINKNIFWQHVIKAKLNNQAHILRSHSLEKGTIIKIEEFSSSVQPGDSTNREGLGARLYFWALFGKDFIRHKDDVKNACLDFGYSLLRAQISRVIVAKGLHPNFGVFHKGTTNFFNLADDILEPFRPIVDDVVYSNFKESAIFTKEHRHKLLEVLTKRILYEGQKQTIPHVIEKIIDSLISFMNNGLIKNLDFFDPVLYDF